ncbi:carbohydrate ABC transporter permease [Nonomuraea africana]|uniref:Multiple sugar transport system permease protein n=2 Tax=Nonomuraea TaxID=83681 RepID=A0ABR9KRL2_9ACTN|nr:carbohydrate ABC transporter permease [Nonomuraea africana]MBE1564177.1 multiple sugar transport system permease protein [Nonomuraea africana]
MIRRAVLVVLGLIWLGPTYLLLVNAARPADGYDASRAWIPSPDLALFRNFAQAWESANLQESLASTALYSLVSPALGVLIGAMAGYTIVVLRLRYGFWWFMLLFGGTVFPSQMLLVPLFVGYSAAGLYDSRFGMILVYTAISVPLSAFVLRNFFTGVAFSIFEAARMDGASTFRIFWRVYLPLATSALAAVFILNFTFIWNDLLFGLTLTQTAEVRPVMTALAGLVTDVYAGTPVPVGLAAGLVVSLPTVVLFVATQRMFARGLALGGLS